MEHNNEQLIRETAYYLWLDAGKPDGQPEAFWYQAITKLKPKRMLAAKKKNRTR